MKTKSDLEILRADLKTLREIFKGSLGAQDMDEIEGVITWVLGD